MGAKSKYWMKFYYEMIDDSKIGKLPDHLFRRWVMLLLMAGEESDGGYLPKVEDIAWRLRPCDLDLLEGDLSQLEAARLITLKEHPKKGVRWHVTNFTKRQARTDAAERQRRYRERKRKEAKEKERRKETREDVDVDIDSVTVTPVTNRNAIVTRQEVNNNNGGNNWKKSLEPEKRQQIDAIEALLKSWKGLTGRGTPADADQRKADYIDPADVLLQRFDWRVTEAFQAVKAKRAEMLADGKTPFRLSAVVPYIIADGDIAASRFELPGGFGDDAKIFT